MHEDEKKEVRDEFRRVVNMAPKELKAWLETEASRSVGHTRKGEDEAIGHQSGRRIIEIRRARQAELSDDDYAHMKKVIGYLPPPQRAAPERRCQRHPLALFPDELGPRPAQVLSTDHPSEATLDGARKSASRDGSEQHPDLGELLDRAEDVAGMAADLAPGQEQDGERTGHARDQGANRNLAEERERDQNGDQDGGRGAQRMRPTGGRGQTVGARRRQHRHRHR
jgi:hypothetical protein